MSRYIFHYFSCFNKDLIKWCQSLLHDSENLLENSICKWGTFISLVVFTLIIKLIIQIFIMFIKIHRRFSKFYETDIYIPFLVFNLLAIIITIHTTIFLIDYWLKLPCSLYNIRSLLYRNLNLLLLLAINSPHTRSFTNYRHSFLLRLFPDTVILAPIHTWFWLESMNEWKDYIISTRLYVFHAIYSN